MTNKRNPPRDQNKQYILHVTINYLFRSTTTSYSNTPSSIHLVAYANTPKLIEDSNNKNHANHIMYSNHHLLLVLVIFLAPYLHFNPGLTTTHASFTPIPKPIKAAVIFAGEGGADLGWEFQWANAIENVANTRPSDVIFTTWPNIASGAPFSNLIHQIQNKTDLFIVTSVTFQFDIISAAEKFQAKFFISPGFLAGTNHMSVAIRFEEARFLSGIISGWLSKTKNFGYVESIPLVETKLALWAFLLGVREILPDAKVYVHQLNSFSDSYRDEIASLDLIERLNCDVLVNHVNSFKSDDIARQKGKMSVGYSSNRHHFIRDSVISSDIQLWDPLISKTLDFLLTGTFPANKNPLHFGLLEGATAQISRSILVNSTVKTSVSSYTAIAQSSLFCGSRVGLASNSDCYTFETFGNILPSGFDFPGVTVTKFFTPLEKSRVLLSSSIAGAVVNLTFSTVSMAEWKNGGSVNFTLPLGFVPVDDWEANGNVSASDLTNAFTWTILQSSSSGNATKATVQWVLVLQRNNTGNVFSGAFEMKMNNLFTNPSSSGVSGTYGCSFYGPDKNKIAESLDITGSTIVDSPLNNFAVSFETLVAGRLGSVKVSGSTENSWPSDGSLQLLFPTGFKLDTLKTGLVETFGSVVPTHANAVFSRTVMENAVVSYDGGNSSVFLNRSGSGEPIKGYFSVSLCCITNPSTVGNTNSKVGIILRDGKGASMTSAFSSNSVVVEDSETPLIEVLGPALGGGMGGLILIACVFFYLWKRRQVKKELANMSWIIQKEELSFEGDENKDEESVSQRLSISTQGKKSVVSMELMFDRKKSSFFQTFNATSSVKASGKSSGLGSELCAVYKGTQVFVSKISRKQFVLPTTETQIEMKQMRNLRHANLTEFVGAVLGPPEVMLVSEYCERGDLANVLEFMDLGWEFRYSIIRDVTNGLIAIHKSDIGSHGRLSTSNIFVDARWVAKVGGYGCPKFRYSPANNLATAEDSDSAYRGLLWTAPELLSKALEKIGPLVSIENIMPGSREGDIWSLGCVLFELVTGSNPYMYSADCSHFLEDLIMGVAEGKVHPNLSKFREGGSSFKLSAGHSFDSNTSEADEEKAFVKGYSKLLRLCFCTQPTGRPSGLKVMTYLKKMNPFKGSLIDYMNRMLTAYSKHLEEIVMERTKDLALKTEELRLEQERSEALLAEILPTKVREDLKQGKEIEPETFDCVSIFFSDIVGFTAIASASSPLEVVALLNRLYVAFDAKISKHGVYKVETIGDAYMIASGLPTRNGDEHAAEIANTALSLLATVNTFAIPHMPNKQLQLRIGLHSGPVVAGVIGLKMPRYCLFGDTVNTASRMESGGMALRIHLSENTQLLLEKTHKGLYHLECRGNIEVKGKGSMRTFWLTGRDGFEDSLPNINLAASLSTHEFK